MAAQYRTFETSVGVMGIVGGPRGLRSVYLPEKSKEAVVRRIRARHPDATPSPRLLPDLVRDLQRYFDGEEVQFRTPIDWTWHGEFDVAIWRTCAKIGYGETCSYGELAERVGRPGAARAVGTAMSHNPNPIVVPCHRVLRSDGALGGYSGPGGVSFKQRLLEMEAEHAARVTA
jgi:methylated-DNA-[protein]-cysteine S-methyltransferase